MPADTTAPTDTTAADTPNADPLADAMGDLGPSAPAEPFASADTVDFIGTIMSEMDPAPAKATDKTQDSVPVEDAEPKKDAPKADASDDTDFPDEPPGKPSAEAKRGWGELKSELRTIRSEKAELEAKIKEYNEKMAALPELEEKAKFAEDAEKELAISRIEATREFKSVVTAPLEAIGSAAEEIAKRNEINSEELFDALAEGDRGKRNKMLENILADVPESDKYEIYKMATDTQSVFARRDELHNRALEARKELEARQKEEGEKTVAEQRKQFETAVKRAASQLKERLPFEPLADGEEVDGVFDLIASRATASDFSAATPDVQAYSVIAGLALPRIVKQYRAIEARAKSAEDRVKELSNASPSDNGSPKPRPSTPSGEIDFVAAVAAEAFGR